MIEILPSIFIFCALPCEAKPLIQAWQLKKLPQPKLPFAIYAHNDRAVIITGIGKTAMAGAVGYTLALFNTCISPILINLGIAGHRQEMLGAFCLANKVIDSETGRVFYPQLAFPIPANSHSVSTHSKPYIEYADDALYDMEAAGFYEMAVKFSTSELIHVVKIVSDNQQSSITNISEALVEDWITQNLLIIENCLKTMREMRQKLQRSESVWQENLIKEFRFTVSGELKLKALLQRWQVLKGDELILWQDANLKSGKALLAWLEKQLHETDYYL